MEPTFISNTGLIYDYNYTYLEIINNVDSFINFAINNINNKTFLQLNSPEFTFIYSKLSEFNNIYTNNILNFNFEQTDNHNLTDITNKELTIYECISNITDVYDNLYIAFLENKSIKGPVSYFTFNFYEKSGQEYFNTSICKNLLTVTETKSLNYDSLTPLQYEAVSRGYNIFDLDSDLYTNSCLIYEMNDKDTHAKLRKEKLFQYVDICEKTCVTSYINSYLFQCECSLYDKMINNRNILNQNIIHNIDKEEYAPTNFGYFKCKYNINTERTFHNNICNYVAILSFLLGIVLLIIYIIKKNEIYRIIDKALNPDSIKSSETEANVEIETQDEMKNKDEKKKEKKFEDRYEIIFDSMDTDNALENDKRSFYKIFYSNLFYTSFIFAIFTQKYIPFHDTIVITYCIFMIITSIFLNMIFYREADITRDYENTSTGTIVGYYILRSAYSGLFLLILNIICSRIIYPIQIYGYNLIEFSDFQVEKNGYGYSMAKKFALEYNARPYAFFGVYLAFTIVYWYFICVFGNIVPKAQLKIVFSFILTIPINYLITIILCFIYAVLRKMSIHFKSKYIYFILYIG